MLKLRVYEETNIYGIYINGMLFRGTSASEEFGRSFSLKFNVDFGWNFC